MSNIDHFENYIQIQKLTCIFKILINDELTTREKKLKTLYTIKTKWGIRICCRPGWSHYVRTETR